MRIAALILLFYVPAMVLLLVTYWLLRLALWKTSAARDARTARWTTKLRYPAGSQPVVAVRVVKVTPRGRVLVELTVSVIPVDVVDFDTVLLQQLELAAMKAVALNVADQSTLGT